MIFSLSVVFNSLNMIDHICACACVSICISSTSGIQITHMLALGCSVLVFLFHFVSLFFSHPVSVWVVSADLSSSSLSLSSAVLSLLMSLPKAFFISVTCFKKFLAFYICLFFIVSISAKMLLLFMHIVLIFQHGLSHIVVVVLNSVSGNSRGLSGSRVWFCCLLCLLTVGLFGFWFYKVAFCNFLLISGHNM